MFWLTMNNLEWDGLQAIRKANIDGLTGFQIPMKTVGQSGLTGG